MGFSNFGGWVEERAKGASHELSDASHRLGVKKVFDGIPFADAIVLLWSTPLKLV